MMDSFVQHAPTIATVGFFIAFCFIIFLVYKKGAKKKFDQYSQIPLNDKN